MQRFPRRCTVNGVSDASVMFWIDDPLYLFFILLSGFYCHILFGLAAVSLWPTYFLLNELAELLQYSLIKEADYSTIASIFWLFSSCLIFFYISVDPTAVLRLHPSPGFSIPSFPPPVTPRWATSSPPPAKFRRVLPSKVAHPHVWNLVLACAGNTVASRVVSASCEVLAQHRWGAMAGHATPVSASVLCQE